MNIAQLPDDPALLKELLARECAARDEQIESALEHCDVHIRKIKDEAAAALAQRETVIAERDAAIAKQQAQLEQIKQEAAQRIEALTQTHQAEINALLRRLYGPRSERFDPAQLLIFGVQIDTLEIDTQAAQAESGQKLSTRKVVKRHNHGRGILPAHLPRIPIEHDLKEQDKACPCCGKTRVRIGQETTEQLEIIPASFKVLKHIQYKYACKECDLAGEHPQIELTPKPPQPIDKGLAGPGLLAYVAVSKYGDHLPLYRLEDIFSRSGLLIARSTMCAWMLAVAALAKPLYGLMCERVRRSRVIHTDDTRLPVQQKDKCKSGRMWAYLGDLDNPYDVYEYTPDRSRDGPSRWLLGYKGYLQADAYGAYDGIYLAQKVIEVACWAHARRKFFDAQGSDGRRSAQMLALVGELYAIEDEAQKKVAQLLKTRPQAPVQEQFDLIRDVRRDKSVPALERIKVWLDKEKVLVLPRSPMAGAIGYVLNQWEALKRYVEEGFLKIDNNAAERAEKRVAIGRKNWLFAGNDAAAQAGAVIYTLIASAQRHGLDPQRYLTGVLARLPGAAMSELERFLPDAWKKNMQAEAAAASSIPATVTA